MPTLEEYAYLLGIPVSDKVPFRGLEEITKSQLRNSKGGGTIVCSIPLLYKWFILHLPQTPVFLENKKCLWRSQRLMFLTNDDITWYGYICDGLKIIDSCGEFSNVPL
ncbi:hypothetical protein KIW84_055120 [Lathyrus oleraceus]|uniref:DUF7745 domain-containing protein n=1 Tax=Pisum sativum TaxID=3888 RepID=A0A9D4WUZ9_PEA|nr:hypothetical protein KIW84_055120 [Pisum sativum]